MLDKYEPGEMALPEFKLVQNVGGDYAKSLGAKPGQFFCALDDTITDELNMVVVDIQATRTYWGRDEIEDSPPDCASVDAKSMQSTTGKDCATCPYRCDTPWLLQPQERRQRCNLSYVIMGIKVDDYLPIIIRAGGISALPVRQLITQLRLNRALKGEYHRAMVNVTSGKKRTSSGEAYALHLRITNLITDEAKANELKAESDNLLGMPIPLPIGRPEEEKEPPIAYTPEGTPVYSEEERARMVAQTSQTAISQQPEEELDLDF
jgi:hypothetical protein